MMLDFFLQLFIPLPRIPPLLHGRSPSWLDSALPLLAFFVVISLLLYFVPSCFFSLISQRHHRIHPHRPPRGEIARKQSNQAQECRHADKRRWISRSNPI